MLQEHMHEFWSDCSDWRHTAILYFSVGFQSHIWKWLKSELKLSEVIDFFLIHIAMKKIDLCHIRGKRFYWNLGHCCLQCNLVSHSLSELTKNWTSLTFSYKEKMKTSNTWSVQRIQSGWSWVCGSPIWGSESWDTYQMWKRYLTVMHFSLKHFCGHLDRVQPVFLGVEWHVMFISNSFMATQIEKCCYVREGLCIAKNINIELIWLHSDTELEVRLFEIFLIKRGGLLLYTLLQKWVHVLDSRDENNKIK